MSKLHMLEATIASRDNGRQGTMERAKAGASALIALHAGTGEIDTSRFGAAFKF